MRFGTPIRQFREARKRGPRLHLTAGQKSLAAVILIVTLMSVLAGAWFGLHFEM
jgi:hypothetical protein